MAEKPARTREAASPPAEPVIAARPDRAQLFKGATRLPTKWGVPSKVLYTVVLGGLCLALINYWLLLILPVVYPVLVVISRNDDRAFRIMGLWLRTKFHARNKRFWGAVSFSPIEYSRRRPWCRSERDTYR